MSKRRNPFGDNSSPQLKTHVRDREVNSGVSQQTRMQAVYDRTQQLLFTGMKEMRERHIPLDFNENCLPHREEAKTDKSDLKQMHLNKSCQLVESASLMDMDTDSNSCHDSRVQHSLPHSLDTFSGFSGAVGAYATDSCKTVLPSFGESFGRSPAEYSPVCVHSPLSSSPSRLGVVPDVVPSSSAGFNAFSYMKQAQFEKAPIRETLLIHNACHNCRQPVKPQDVAKCQFCEIGICNACFRQCSGCFLCFCQLCSVINYDLPTERSFCLNCQDR